MEEQEQLPDDANFDLHEEEETPGHWRVIRDVIVFQFKLAMDGIRDLLLSPVSIGAGIYGLIFSPDDPGKYFNQLLKFGRKTDVWINLFGETHYSEDDRPGDSSDVHIKKLEDLLRAEYEKGGIVKNLKKSTDDIIERLRKEQNRKP